MDIVLEARNVSFRLDGREILQGLNFQLPRGDIYAILGPSGSGKSVLLKILSGLLLPDEGSVLIKGVDLATASKETLQALRVQIGFVFQDAALISNMSIFDNVALPLRYHTGLGELEVQACVSEKMALFGVDRQYDRFIPAQLSLGVRKRAALARALILEPELLFLDEPTTGLGPEADRLIARVLKSYQEKARASILLITSEWPFAIALADRIGSLESGQIVAAGTAEEMRSKVEEINQAGFSRN